MKPLILIMLLSPLAGAVFNALSAGRVSRRLVRVSACTAVIISLAASLAALILAGGQTADFSFLSWIELDRFSASMDVHYDALASLMALMVTFVACIIHLYSAVSMREDPGLIRYLVYLNLFTFSMLVVSLADNLVFVYLGWEGMGFCSYSLIGFWYAKEANASAGRKAFLYTRIGDIAFGVAIALCFFWLGELNISGLAAKASGLDENGALILGLLLIWTAAGKSAQLPLSVWLPDAMAGPSPVSALIHAATMVTAGVYLLMRLFPLVQASETVLWLLGAAGALTALWAALAALAQRDIKRVLAYSTISQVGYMFLALGAADIVGGAFHLISHAMFKSLLFLTAGCVIDAMHDEHDIYRMGNLRRLMPQVGALFLIGALCLSAFPLLGGFFSKDRILLAAYLTPGISFQFFWAAGFAAALLTPFYVFRVYFLAFGPRKKGPDAQRVKNPASSLTWVLWPLAGLALGDGMLNLPAGPGKNWLANFMAGVPGARPELAASAQVEWAMALASALGVLAAIWLAWRFNRNPSGEPAPAPWRESLAQAFYLDQAQHALLVRPYRAVAEFLWREADDGGIDLGFMTLAQALGMVSRGWASWSCGRLSVYFVSLLLAMAAVLGVMALGWLAW